MLALKTLGKLLGIGVLFALSPSASIASDSSHGSKDKYTTQNLLKSYLDLASFRHKVLSENMANINTPGYKANEVDMPKKIEDLVKTEGKHRKVSLAVTSKRHIAGKDGVGGRFASHKIKDPYEVKLNGNNVSLAQQMAKVSQNNSAYETAMKAYQSGYSLVATVHGKN